MKKFYSFLVAAVLLMGATSCQKEATADAGAADNVEFVASIAGGRTELGNGNQVMWNDGDKIRIFTRENFAGTEFDSDATAATATAKFTTTQSFTASDNGYLAVYPESANKTDNGFSSTVHNASYAEGVWSIPVNMQGWDNFNYPFTFEKNSFMAAFSNDNQLSFKAATAMLKIKNVKNAGWGSVAFTGANLGGEATLHYDTNNAENPISYTLGTGDSRVDYYFSNDAETIYVPIYPGTVTGFTVYSGNDVLVEYTKTITFDAGVIYDLDLDNAPVGGGNEEEQSPYAVKDWLSYGGTTTVQMVIENGYHVAKNVPLNEGGYAIFSGWDPVYAVGAVALNTWVDATLTAPITFEADCVDIYLKEDAALICVVPAGTPFENLPALPTYEPSLYGLMNMTTGSFVSMIIKDGFHYAKLTTSNWSEDSYLVVDPDGNGLGFTTQYAEPSTWYKTGVWSETSAWKPITIATYADMEAQVYISADGAWMGVAYPDYALPAVPTQSAWCLRGDHNNWGNDGVPTTPMYDMGDYSVAYGVQFTAGQKFKFEHTGTWVGGFASTATIDTWNLTGSADISVNTTGTYDIYCLKNDRAYLIQATGTNFIPEYKTAVKENHLYFSPNANWRNSDAYIALFCNGTSEAKWCKMTAVGVQGYYEVEIPGTTTQYKNVLFLRVDPNKTEYNWNNGSVWDQTNDLTWNTTNNLFTIKEGEWNYAQGSWSKITEY